MEIREVTPGEWEAAGRVMVAAWEEYARPEYLEELRRVGDRTTRTTVLVAVDPGGGVVGCVTLETDGRVDPAQDPPAPHEAHVRMLAVPPEHRRRGIARALVERCIEVSRERGRSLLTLHTGERMLAARRLYESMGFVQGPPATSRSGDCLFSYELRIGSAAPSR